MYVFPNYSEIYHLNGCTVQLHEDYQTISLYSIIVNKFKFMILFLLVFPIMKLKNVISVVLLSSFQLHVHVLIAYVDSCLKYYLYIVISELL